MKLPLNKKTALMSVILLSVVINFQIFCYAYPQTFEPQSPTLARDFSAYYIAAWRLFHNPAAVYSDGVQPGDYKIIGQPQTFRYPPFFLMLFAPFLILSYQNALNAFNIIQFLSILASAFFVYRLIENKPLIISSVVAVIVLVNPLLFPLIFSPSGGYGLTDFLHWRIVSLHLQTISPCYYNGYLLANAHILQNTLLVGALYFGFTKKPWLSAVLFTFGALDPRAALFSLPLLLWYNRHTVRKFIAGSAAFLAVTNLPFFFYYGIGFAFFQTNFRISIVSDMILCDWIPIFSIAAQALLEIVTAIYGRRLGLIFRPRELRKQNKTKKALTNKTCLMFPLKQFIFQFIGTKLTVQ
ncbi:DUF2029 domain-containing protein [Candidatus Bathyarchaeota archaeon A05DMB-2]|jgi:hypothetical protein|nr:DUF2029 domain-containing protein [Candidatus Bathyarchaeota archaeon A05DMB-2]